MWFLNEQSYYNGSKQETQEKNEKASKENPWKPIKNFQGDAEI